jgi:hypothetical protein
MRISGIWLNRAFTLPFLLLSGTEFCRAFHLQTPHQHSLDPIGHLIAASFYVLIAIRLLQRSVQEFREPALDPLNLQTIIPTTVQIVKSQWSWKWILGAYGLLMALLLITVGLGWVGKAVLSQTPVDLAALSALHPAYIPALILTMQLSPENFQTWVVLPGIFFDIFLHDVLP